MVGLIGEKSTINIQEQDNEEIQKFKNSHQKDQEFEGEQAKEKERKEKEGVRGELTAVH